MSTQGKVVAVILLIALAIGGALYFQSKTVSTHIAYTQRVNVTLSAQESGRVESMPFREGDTVPRHAIVATLGDAHWERERLILTQTLSHHTMALKHLSLSLDALSKEEQQLHDYLRETSRSRELTHRRLDALVTSGVKGIDREIDDVRWTLHTQTADALRWQREIDVSRTRQLLTGQTMAATQLSIQHSREKLDYHTALYDRFQVISSDNGRISRIHVYPGDSVTPGQPVITLTSLTEDTYITAYFDEADYAHLIPGAPVTITLDANPDTPYHGIISSVSPLAGASVSGNYPNYSSGSFTRIGQKIPVNIAFDSPVRDLPAGLSATVKLTPL